jgi:CheY-like chemotaxis protein
VGTEVILLVDDDPDDVFFTRHVLKRHGITHEIVVAIDGESALELLLPDLTQAPLCPAVVLLDLNMPGIGGRETLRRLRAQQPTDTLPVLAFTTTARDRELVTAAQSQLTVAIQKPLTFSDFEKASAQLGLHW